MEIAATNIQRLEEDHHGTRLWQLPLERARECQSISIRLSCDVRGGKETGSPESTKRTVNREPRRPPLQPKPLTHFSVAAAFYIPLVSPSALLFVVVLQCVDLFIY